MVPCTEIAFICIWEKGQLNRSFSGWNGILKMVLVECFMVMLHGTIFNHNFQQSFLTIFNETNVTKLCCSNHMLHETNFKAVLQVQLALSANCVKTQWRWCYMNQLQQNLGNNVASIWIAFKLPQHVTAIKCCSKNRPVHHVTRRRFLTQHCCFKNRPV